MTAVIDRTLSEEPLYAARLRKEHIVSYSEALEVCGAEYIEIGRELLPVLEDVDLSSRYILRIRKEEEILACCERRFAYVSLPISMGRYFRAVSMEQNVIAEVFADEYSAPAVLLHLKSSGLLKYISMIRITGFFSPEAEPMMKLIGWFRERFIQSVEICALNRGLCGCVSAIGAKEAGADAVSLTFGQNGRYASLESYYIDTHILSRTFMPKEIISGICRASTAYLNIFGSLPCGLCQLDELADRLKAPVCDPEKGVVYRTFSVNRKKEDEQEKSGAVKRRIESLELEDELEKAVFEAVRRAGLLNI